MALNNLLVQNILSEHKNEKVVKTVTDYERASEIVRRTYAAMGRYKVANTSDGNTNDLNAKIKTSNYASTH